ncbi:MAG: PilW family protein [Pseudomonadota bacterium]|nr:PilW family protein [Pseudomonadota bacterium]
MRARPSSLPRSRSLGLSLVEILVGVAIGLIGIVAIFQAVAVWTKHTQTTSSGGDAQVAGTLALFNIERDLKQAGHGFGRAIAPVMGCAVAATDTTPARAFNFGLRAVQVATGASGAPDQISVLYGDSSFYVEEGAFSNSTATTKKLQRRGGFKMGDLAVVAVNPGASAGAANCQLIEINDDTNVDGYTVAHTTAPYVSFYAPSAPAAAPRFNAAASPPAFNSGTIYNLGPQPRLDVWSIQGNRVLTRTDLLLDPTTPRQIAEGVINLKAEYGVDANADCQVAPAEWSASAPANWRSLMAVRVAVLVRSRQYELNRDQGASGVRAVTPSASNPYYFADPAKTFLMTNVDGTADTFNDATPDPNNWRYYRYRVYERVIPLRNMVWGTC